MTQQLKDLMRQATDRPAFTPDVDQLLTTGRRQTRKRHLLVTIAAAASVAVVAGGTVFALDETGGQLAPAAAPTPSLPPSETEGSSRACTDQRVNVLDASRWPAVITVQDAHGIATIRRSPTESHRIAYCATEWGIGAKGPVIISGEKAGIVLRKSAAVRRGQAEPGIVTTVLGVVPVGVKRITVETPDGHVGVATIEGPYYAYRRIESTPWPGPEQSVVVRFKYHGRPDLVVVRS